MYIRFDPIHRLRFELGEVEFDFTNPNICHGGGKGGGGGGTNTVTSSAPPPETMAAYQTALTAAQKASSQPLTQYNAPTVAGFTPDQLSAFGTLSNAQNIPQQYLSGAQNLIQQGTQPLWPNVQQFTPENLNQYMSPYTGQVLDTAVAQQQNRNAMQQQALKGNAISSGAWGGDRAGVASAVLSGQQSLADNATNANILNQGYAQGLGEFNTQQQAQLGANEANAYLNQQGAFGLAGLGNQAFNTALVGGNAQLQAGNQQQQLGQSILNVPYQQFLQQQGYPFQTSQFFTNAAEGIGGNTGGSSSSTMSGASPSTGSQVLGGILGAGSLLGESGAFGGLFGTAAGAGWLLNRGGRIPYRRGGPVRQGYAMGGDVPDVSISFVPNTQSMAAGKGPPAPVVPQTAPTQQNDQSSIDIGSLIKNMKKPAAPGAMGAGITPDAAQTWNLGANQGQPFGDIASAAEQQGNISNFMQNGGGGDLSGLLNFFKSRGGSVGYDDGGVVGGLTPLDLSSAGGTPSGQNDESNYQRMSPQQLQVVLMRLPAGSREAQSAQEVLRQKNLMPNVGVQATGGFGSQQPQQQPQEQPPQGMADGGIPLPPGGDDDQMRRRLELADEVNAASPNVAAAQPVSTVPLNDLQQPQQGAMGRGPPPPPVIPAPQAEQPQQGGMGAALQQVAQNEHPSYAADEPPNTRAPAKADPWLALANAGFAMAAGQSPNAMVNIGRGAMEGIKSYREQQKEADTVNQAADKLMAEAKQHKDSIAIQQQNADTSRMNAGTLEQSRLDTAATGRMNANSTAAERAETARHNLAEEGLSGKKIDVLKQRSDAGLLSPDNLDFMADQYLAGDKSVIAGLGYGNAGAANRAALRESIQQRAFEAGLSPAQVAGQLAEYQGTLAENRAIGTRTGAIRVSAEAVKGAADMALESSAKFDRGEYPNLNAVEQAVAKGTGDPAIVDFMIKNNTLINEYAAAQNPRGIPRIEDKKYARDLLDTAYSKGQYETGVSAIQQEVANIKHATSTVRGHNDGAASPSQKDVEYLKNNPAAAAKFDARFGTGASKKILGGQP